MKYRPRLQFEDKFNIRDKTISEIEKLIEEINIDRDLIDSLYADKRKMTSKLAVKCEKKLRKNKILEEKFREYKNIENQLYDKGFERIFGFYVTGLTAVAGPLTFCLIKLNRFTKIKKVEYSNYLTAKKRKKLYKEIKNQAEYIDILHLGSESIDKLGLKSSIFKGYHEIKNRLSENIELNFEKDFFLYYKYGLDHENSKVIKNTQKQVYLLACASIAAKVEREKKMTKLSNKYPNYDFEENHGYITKSHRRAVRKGGFSPIHRRSFDFEKKLKFDF